MARIKQWCVQQQLSYLVFDPISRRCALIDPIVELEDSYLRFMDQKGLSLVWQLFTSDTAYPLPIESRVVAPKQSAAISRLDMGELDVKVIHDISGKRLAFICDGMLFSGDWWLANGLRPSVASAPDTDSDKLPLLQFPEETLVMPGRVSNNLSISSIAQEKALCRAAGLDYRP